MSFTPSGQQVAIVALLVEEYRNGVLIGTVMREIQVTVLSAAFCSQPPVFAAPAHFHGGNLSGSTLLTCIGGLLQFDVSVTDSTGSAVSLNSNVGTGFVGPAFTSHTTGVTTTGTFSWTPTAADRGTHSFVVFYTDYSCPIVQVNAAEYTVQVAGRCVGPVIHFPPIVLPGHH
jgi:hypothetical protein